MVTGVSTGNHATSMVVEISAFVAGISELMWTYNSFPGFMGVIGDLYHISPILCINDVFDKS